MVDWGDQLDFCHKKTSNDKYKYINNSINTKKNPMSFLSYILAATTTQYYDTNK